MFHYLQEQCTSHNRTLTAADLATAKSDLLNSVSGIIDFFECVHRQCMTASGVEVSPILSQKKIFASILLACSQRAAERCFSIQTSLTDVLLDFFYEAFSESVERRMDVEIRARLARAYVRSARKFRQELSIGKLLLQEDIKSLLFDHILPLVKPDEPELIEALSRTLVHDINLYMTQNISRIGRSVDGITDAQMLAFLTQLPDEIRNSVGRFEAA